MAELININESIILKYNEPFINAKYIRGFVDDSIESSTKYFLKEFRWSIDNLVYSGWNLLDTEHLQSLELDYTKPFWIQYRYTVIGTSDNTILSINNITLDIDFHIDSKIASFSPNNLECECETSSGIFNPNCTPFNPYALNSSINIFKDLSLFINNTFGIESQYFKKSPVKGSGDFIFKEWTLQNIKKEDAKCIKIVVPNNEFPDSKINFNEFGTDFEVPFEIHLDKRYFESFYGKGAMPQRKDIVFIPMMNRLYEVSGSYLFRSYMNEPTYFIVSLIKHKPVSTDIIDQELEDAFDRITIQSDELFKEQITEEILKTTKQEHYSISSLDEDPTRELMHKDLALVAENINNNYTIISDYNYRLESILGSENIIGVKYHTKNNWEEIENRSFTCWFQKTDLAQNNFKSIIAITNNNDGTFTTRFDAIHSWKVGDEIILSLSNGTEVGTAIINNIISTDTVTFTWISTKVFPQLGWKAYNSNPIHFISGYENGEGLKIEHIGNRSFRVDINSKSYIFNLPFNLSSNSWYGLVINMSNTFKEISLYLWQIDSIVKSTKLKLLFSNVKPLETVLINNNVNYVLKSTKLKLTNIRLFREIMEPEKQSNILNQHIVKDTHLALIIDNCKPMLKLPNVTKKY